MKRVTFLLLFIYHTFVSFCQVSTEKRVIVYFGQVFSGISYKNSIGQTDSYLNKKIKSTYGISYQRFFNKITFIQPSFSYINLGAQSTVNNQKVEWDFHYIGVSIGAGVGRTRKYIHSDFIFKPYGLISFYAQYAYKADQTVGELYFNLLDDNQFRNYDLGIRLTGGLMIDFADNLALTAEYKYLRSIINLEKEHRDQKMRNEANCLVFGLIVKI